MQDSLDQIQTVLKDLAKSNMQDGVILEKKSGPKITQIQNQNPNLQDSRELKISFGNDNLWMDEIWKDKLLLMLLGGITIVRHL